MVGVEDEEDVDGARIDRIRHVARLRHPRNHREEVVRIRQRVVGIHVRHPLHMPVRKRRNRRHLRQEPDERNVALARIVNVFRCRIERRQRGHTGRHHRHRVRVVAKAFHELLDILMHVRVVRDVVCELVVLGLRGQLSVPQQPGDLEEARLFRELLDRIAAIAKDSLVAVDVGDGRAARRGVHERRIVSHHAEIIILHLDLAKVSSADRVVGDRDRVGLTSA